MKKPKKTLCTLVAAVALGCGVFITAGCNSNDYKEKIKQEQLQEKEQLESIYSNAQVIAKYSIPFVEIKTKKTSFTLDILKHLGNEMKAQTIRLPVSEDYFTSVSVGQELQSKFNIGGLIFRGEIEEYSVTISNKFKNDVFYVRTNEGWKEITSHEYKILIELNNQRKEFIQQEEVLVRNNTPEQIKDEAKKSCEIIIESEKTNFTLDILQHLENKWNKMKYPIKIPKFLGDKLEVGSTIDKDFVGSSLFFSRSPSVITYKVLEKRCE